MDLFYIEEHTSCTNYVADVKCGFKIVTPFKGDTFTNIDAANNNIVFVMDGKIEFSCNEYTDRLFEAGSIVFLPQSSDIFGRALTDCKMIILVFNYHLSNLCDKYTLTQCAKKCNVINYTFAGLPFRRPITSFLDLLEEYLVAGVSCVHLHEIKQKELFIIFRTVYTKQEIAEFFYPVLGRDMDFKSKVLEKYRMGYNIKEFSSQLSMHEKYFPKKFKKEFGISYHQWTLKQKAKHVKHKLTLPKTTIKDVIKEFGFADYSHFNHFCKEQFGCSPSELITNIRAEKSGE